MFRSELLEKLIDPRGAAAFIYNHARVTCDVEQADRICWRSSGQHGQPVRRRAALHRTISPMQAESVQMVAKLRVMANRSVGFRVLDERKLQYIRARWKQPAQASHEIPVDIEASDGRSAVLLKHPASVRHLIRDRYQHH